MKRAESIPQEIRTGWSRVIRFVRSRWQGLVFSESGRTVPQNPLRAFSRYNRSYFQRWLFLGTLIGIVAGIGAILFAAAIALSSHLLLGGIAGFSPPQPAGEGQTIITPITHRWLIPVVTTLGGLLTGLIVFNLAPEAEGHGTDSAIQAFHEKNGAIRSRIPLVKLIASAITIGSGGSAGREGPTAQISAGFGSLLGTIFHLDEHDRRIAEAAGIGAGIGAIFKAPFGGALLSAEILYKRDFEADALFPSFIASVVGFAIYGTWAGWTPIFGMGGHFQFVNAASLGGYLILGLAAGAIGLLYPKTLYGIRSLFHRIHIPTYFKPAIGGLLVGIIGLYLPQALGMGYGYVQFGVNNDYLHVTAWMMAILVLVKILTTSLTIDSGGSGGVFGPGMVIGGFLGGALWAALHALTPALVAGTNPGAFVVVGMGAFFGGIAKAPLAVILMVAEMTGEYSLIAPAMLATMVAYLVTGDTSIYESQVPTRVDSPAHRNDYALPLLQSLRVGDVMIEGVGGAIATATPDTTFDTLARLICERHLMTIPILDQQRFLGVVTASDLARIRPEDAQNTLARQVMSRQAIRAFPDEPLYAAWLRMSRKGLRHLAVVNRQQPDELLGVINTGTIDDLLKQSSTLPPVQVQGLTETRSEAPQIDSQEVAGDPLTSTKVAQAMLRTPRLLLETDPVTRAQEMLEQRGAALMVVDNSGSLVGIVTRSDLRELDTPMSHETLTVGTIAVRNLVIARPEESLQSAAARMAQLGLRQLPVIAHELPAPPVGLLRRSDILTAYQQALAPEAATQAPEWE